MSDRPTSIRPAASRGRTLALPLTVQFAARRRVLGIPRTTLANKLGVYPSAVSKWDHGRASPKLAYAVDYAGVLHWHLVLHDGYQVLAEGEDIACALPGLRRQAGLRQRDLAALLNVQTVTVAMYETRGCAQLDTTESWAAGLGLHIGVETLDGVLVFDAAVTAGRWAA